MPKVNTGKDKNTKIVQLIWGAAAAQGKSTAEIARLMGLSPNTMTSRRHNPGTFTVDELKRAGKILDISIDELRSAITY